MNSANQVGTIIYGKVWSMFQGSGYMLIIGLVIFTLDGEDGDAIFDKGRRRIILSAQRV